MENAPLGHAAQEEIEDPAKMPVEIVARQPQGEQSNSRPNRDVGAMHVALNVDDIDAVYADLKDSLAFNSEPQTVATGPWAGNRVAYLSDPDGTPVELVMDVS